MSSKHRVTGAGVLSKSCCPLSAAGVCPPGHFSPVLEPRALLETTFPLSPIRSGPL